MLLGLIEVDWWVSDYQTEGGGERYIGVKGVKYSVTEGNLTIRFVFVLVACFDFGPVVIM